MINAEEARSLAIKNSKRSVTYERIVAAIQLAAPRGEFEVDVDDHEREPLKEFELQAIRGLGYRISKGDYNNYWHIHW